LACQKNIYSDDDSLSDSDTDLFRGIYKQTKFVQLEKVLKDDFNKFEYYDFTNEDDAKEKEFEEEEENLALKKREISEQIYKNKLF